MLGGRADPLLVEREDAQRLLLSELTDPGYRQAQPGAIERIYTWLLEQFQKLLDSLGSVAGDGRLWVLAVAIAALAGAGVVARRRLGPRGRGQQVDELLGASALSAEDHRVRAEEMRSAGDLGGAIRERLRAMVRTCEETGIVSPQPSWTADEISRAVASNLPTASAAVREATAIFDDVWYGDAPATPALYARISELDAELVSMERAG